MNYLNSFSFDGFINETPEEIDEGKFIFLTVRQTAKNQHGENSSLHFKVNVPNGTTQAIIMKKYGVKGSPVTITGRFTPYRATNGEKTWTEQRVLAGFVKFSGHYNEIMADEIDARLEAKDTAVTK